MLLLKETIIVLSSLCIHSVILFFELYLASGFSKFWSSLVSASELSLSRVLHLVSVSFRFLCCIMWVMIFILFSQHRVSKSHYRCLIFTSVKPVVVDVTALMVVGMIGAFLFILIQLVLLVDFAHAWNERWLGNYEESQSRIWFTGTALTCLSVFCM